MYGCEEEDAMTLFRAGRSMSIIAAAGGQQADDDVLNLYGNPSSATEPHRLCYEHQQQV